MKEVLQALRARTTHVPGSFNDDEWYAKCAELDWRCIDCGRQQGERLADGERLVLTVGHAQPIVRGGSNNIDNLILQCRSCNSRQYTKMHPSTPFYDPAEWEPRKCVTVRLTDEQHEILRDFCFQRRTGFQAVIIAGLVKAGIIDP